MARKKFQVERPFLEIGGLPRDYCQRQPYWVFLYNDFVLQTEAGSLQARLGPVEEAILERLDELAGNMDSHAEKTALGEACRKILQLKNEKLGFPPVLDRTA